MSNLIKESLSNKFNDELNLKKRNSFNNTSVQMIVSSVKKKSFFFPINELEKPTIDLVLSTVPLFYDPITKQLVLQKEFEYNNFNKKNVEISNETSETESYTKSDNNFNTNLKNKYSKSKSSDLDLIEERKFLETQLDDFTTKSIELSKRPLEIKLLDRNFLDEKLDRSNNLTNNKKEIKNISFSTNEINQLNKLETLNNNTTLIKCLPNSFINKKTEDCVNKGTSNIQPEKKDSYKTHRRTPSYIHDFHNAIKNNQNSNKLALITASSAAAATAKLTTTSLANATSTLSISTSTTKFTDQITYLNSNKSISSKPTYGKHINFNKFKFKMNSQDSVNELKNQSKSLIIDTSEIDVENLNLPLPDLTKPKKFTLITDSLQNVLQKFKSKQCESKKYKSISNSLSPTSTTALILENRPSNLPVKSEIEKLKHNLLYDNMVKEAKKKEIKVAKLNKENLIKKKKEEENLINTIKTWKNEIILNFNEMRYKKKVKELWFQGIPPSLRSEVWKLAIGNDLNLNNEFYETCLNKWIETNKLTKLYFEQKELIKSDEKKLAYLEQCKLFSRSNFNSDNEPINRLMKLDVSRTFPNLGLFQEGAPYHETLLQVLGSYVFSYRSDIGYIQGMSFLVGMLLLNMEPSDAFKAFSNLLNNFSILMTFIKVDQKGMNAYYRTFDVYFQLNMPELYNHFKQQKLDTDLFIMDWIYTLFTKTLPLDISTRIWDLLFRDGEELILKASLTLLKMFEKQLIMNDFINCAQFLTQLNSNNLMFDEDLFFNTLYNIKLPLVNIDKMKCKNFQALFVYFCSKSE